MERTVLHCDMNSFYASVELLDYPQLRDVPMAVCGNPKNRHGIILAKNDLARKSGVQTAETLWQAKKKCPQLQCVLPHHDKYRRYHHIINEIYGRYTDMVEPFSVDESWLDVSGSLKLFGSGKEIADDIRATVRRETGLTLSAGVSFNKFLAKMGSEYKKPDATTVLSKENFRDLLWPLPIGDMFMIGKATERKLISLGVKTIGELACSKRDSLITLLGTLGGDLHDYANGIDERPVALQSERRKIKSVGHGITFHRNLTGEEDLRTATLGLADKVCARLRKYQLRAGGVKVEIKDPQFNTISRQKQLEYASSIPEEIAKAAMELIHAGWKKSRPIRLLTITAISLTDEDSAVQLTIFDQKNTAHERLEKVSRTIDDIRDRFGDDSITFGRILGNDIGIRTDEKKDE
ncbi:MAG: DNA polymerase IV [Anaerovoracaceae bacterium]|jgi:DNA polymerase-4